MVPIPVGALRHPATAGSIERRWLLDRPAAARAARTLLVAGVVLSGFLLAASAVAAVREGEDLFGAEVAWQILDGNRQAVWVQMALRYQQLLKQRLMVAYYTFKGRGKAFIVGFL